MLPQKPALETLDPRDSKQPPLIERSNRRQPGQVYYQSSRDGQMFALIRDTQESVDLLKACVGATFVLGRGPFLPVVRRPLP